MILNGNIDYIAFECLAERTIAIAQAEKLKILKDIMDYWKKRFEKDFTYLCREKIKIITNMGAANPVSAIKKIKRYSNSKKY